tara:strand:- start:7747 stop:7908 length:162 start_codon:yes stop_codon:yes gene_type:complete
MKTIKLTEVEIKILELGLDLYIDECEECHGTKTDKNYSGEMQLAWDIKDKLRR